MFARFPGKGRVWDIRDTKYERLVERVFSVFTFEAFAEQRLELTSVRNERCGEPICFLRVKSWEESRNAQVLQSVGRYLGRG